MRGWECRNFEENNYKLKELDKRLRQINRDIDVNKRSGGFESQSFEKHRRGGAD